MVEGLRRIAMKLEMPRAGAGAGAALQNSGAGDELAAHFAGRCAALRAARQALAVRADAAERQFAAEARAVDALAGEWRAFQGTLGTLGALGAELQHVRARVDALVRACDALETACTVAAEAAARARAEREAAQRTRTLDAHRDAARRRTERLARELDDAAQRAEADAHTRARQRVDGYKRRVELAFEKAARKDFSDWRAGRTQPRSPASAGAPAPASAAGAAGEEGAARPPVLEAEQQQLEKMLEGVEPVGASEPPAAAAAAGEEPEKTEEEAAEPADDHEKAPKVLGDVDEL